MTAGLLFTVIFLVLQFTGQIHWEWWQIVLPMFIEFGLWAIAGLVGLALLLAAVWFSND